MASRTVGALFASVEDYGPKRWAAIFVGPPASLDGPTIRVALRRVTTTIEEAQPLLDAIPAERFEPAWRAAVEESRAWQALAAAAARRRDPEPPCATLPEWPEAAARSEAA